MNGKDALDAVYSVVYGPRIYEAERLNRIAASLVPHFTDAPRVEMPKDPTRTMLNLARKSRTNFLPLVVGAYSQVMKVEGIGQSRQHDNGPAWSYWQANSMDARQSGIHRSALSYGAAYVTVMPGQPKPKIRGVSARLMTAVYADPADDEWPMMALKVDGPIHTLYDEEFVYFFGAEKAPRSGLGLPVWPGGYPTLTFIEARPHGLGVCPVVRFRDRFLLEGEEQFGMVEPLISLQDRIDETTYGLLIAQYYAAFKQRYIIGWVPKSEQEELEASVADFWAFKDDTVKVGEFTETDLTRYLESKDSALHDLAALAQLPVQNLGSGGRVSNVSAEALASLQEGKDRNTDEITTSFGESHEQVLRLAGHADGNETVAGDFASHVRWKDATARSLAQTVDALGKMVTMLGIPPEKVWPMIPGWTDQDQKDAVDAVKQGDTLTALLGTLNRQTGQSPPAMPGQASASSLA